jgi:hypothetical protein
MAEFLFLFRGGDATALQQSPEEMQAQMKKWMDWMGDLSKKGIMLGAQPLERGGKLVKGTRKIVSDGPFAEGKEMVGGYLLCKADSLDEAVEISKGCPVLSFDGGIVEVRPIQAMNM